MYGQNNQVGGKYLVNSQSVSSLTQGGGEDTYTLVFTVTEDAPLGKLVLVSVQVRVKILMGLYRKLKHYDLSESAN